MRPKSSGKHLPIRLLERKRKLKSGKTEIYYVYNGRDECGKRVEKSLGKEIGEAKLRWAELEGHASRAIGTTLKVVFDRYVKERMPRLGPKTQRDYFSRLTFLRPVFDSAPVDKVTKAHIGTYHSTRSKDAEVRANREIELLQTIWNMAFTLDWIKKEYPGHGALKNTEKPRGYYADDEVWAAVYNEACIELRDAMELNYLNGQRQADVLKMRFSDIYDGVLQVIQNKTEVKLRIEIGEGDDLSELGKLLEKIRSRPGSSFCQYIIATPEGKRLSESMLRKRFEEARKGAAEKATAIGKDCLAERIRAFQFRDIRPKAATEMPLAQASELLGHTDQQITKKVYTRRGKVVKPTR